MDIMLGAAIAFLISLVFYLLSKSKARINYQRSSLKIIGNIDLKLPKDFHVMLGEEKINSLYKSQVIIWNGGKTTIRNQDIVESDPLRIVFSTDTKIFNSIITGVSRETNQINLKKSELENELNINFDFLDKKDGAILEILHTGSAEELKIVGTVRGLVDGIKDKGFVKYISSHRNKKFLVLSWLLPFFLAVFVGGLITVFQIMLKEQMNQLSVAQLFFSLSLGIYIPILISFNSFSIFKSKYPPGIKLKK